MAVMDSRLHHVLVAKTDSRSDCLRVLAAGSSEEDEGSDHIRSCSAAWTYAEHYCASCI